MPPVAVLLLLPRCQLACLSRCSCEGVGVKVTVLLYVSAKAGSACHGNIGVVACKLISFDIAAGGVGPAPAESSPSASSVTSPVAAAASAVTSPVAAAVGSVTSPVASAVSSVTGGSPPASPSGGVGSAISSLVGRRLLAPSLA